MDNNAQHLIIGKFNLERMTQINEMPAANGKAYNAMLEKSLSPIWKMTYYTGMLFDWCRPMSGPKHAIIKILRLVTIFFAFAYSVMIPITFMVDLIPTISNMDFNKKALQLAIFCWMLLSFIMHLNLLLHHQQIATFFQDFKENLSPMNNMRFFSTTQNHKDSSKKYLFLTYSIYASIMLIFTVMNSSQLISIFDNASAKDAQDFTSILSFTIEMLRSFSDVYNSFFTGLADIIPIFIYYHAALNVEILNHQWKSVANSILEEGKGRNVKKISGNEEEALFSSIAKEEIYKISHLYDSIVQLVSRADNLFGLIIIFSKGLSIFVMCCFIPTLINSSQEKFISPMYPFILTVFIFRLVWLIFMSSKLYVSAARLRATVLSFKSRSKSDDLSPCVEKAINSLLTQLQDDKLAASPMGLYSITPSIFLSLLNVVVTYVIIIWQADSQAHQ